MILTGEKEDVKLVLCERRESSIQIESILSLVYVQSIEIKLHFDFLCTEGRTTSLN